MSGPTLDGLTAEHLLQYCEDVAIAALIEAAKPTALPDILVKSMRMAAYGGAKAMFDELLRRGLIVERP
jgi:hypothetical protein